LQVLDLGALDGLLMTIRSHRLPAWSEVDKVPLSNIWQEKITEWPCKPSSVSTFAKAMVDGGHSSGTVVAGSLKRPTREPRTGRPRSLLYLALHRMGFT